MSITISSRKICGIIFSLLVLACFVGEASAQLLDDILLNSAPDGKVVALIKLSGPVQYLRHVPSNKGNHLEIFFTIIPDTPQTQANDPWQGYEARTSPPSDLIPSFTVSTRNLTTEPKLVIDFSRSAEFNVRIGKSNRSFVITITPDKAQAKSEKAATINAPLKIVAAVPVVATASAPVTAAAPATQVPPSVAQTARAAAVIPPAVIPPVVAPPVVVPPAPVVVAAASTDTPAESAGPIAAEIPLADQIKATDTQAEALMGTGRDALKTKQYGVAIESFNKVLLLPPNKFSQEAQELVGVAREDAGQGFKAQREYETYLKMYSSGEGVARVKDRLAKLTASAAKAAEAARPSQTVQDVSQVAGSASSSDRKSFQTVSNGGVSMNYYRGASQTAISGSTTPTTTITDQSMLITNVNASLRTRNDRYDNRLVFQDTYNKNYLDTQLSNSTSNPNRLSSLYYDFSDRVTDFTTRLGRQSPTGGGAMGRFDGISAGYGITQNFRLVGATGQLSDYGTGSKPTFYSLGLGLKNSAHWGGSAYFVSQTTNGLTDRRALGAEVRYFDVKMNAFSMMEYDTFFHVLNMALLQGSINGVPGTTYNFNLDHRRSPSMSLSNSLMGSPSSMSTMLQNGFTIDNLKALAILRTATSDSASVGVNTQIKENWQTGADLNVSKTSGLPESGTNVPGSLDGYMPATPSSGNNYGLNGRLIGNGVFVAHDVSVFSLGYTSSLLSKGENFTFSNHLNMSDKWALDSSFRLNWQSSYDSITRDLTSKVTTLSPAFRVNYQMRRNVNLEVDYGLDVTENTPTTGETSRTTRNYFSLGGRWDF